jgi:hypothetical protein
MARKRPGETLTDKQRTFCNEYVIELNATNAAIKAGYSEESARSTASHLLDDPDVAAYIVRLQEDKFYRLRITADQVLAELARIGFGEVEDLEEDGRGSTSPLERDTALTMTNGSSDKDRKAESQRILSSLSFKKGQTFRDGDGRIIKPKTQEDGSASPDSYRDTMTSEGTTGGGNEAHSMVKRGAMSYRRVVVDEASGTKTTYTFTLRDKIMALRIIAQHLGLLVPDKTKQKIERILIAPKGRVFDDDDKNVIM